MLKRCVLPQFSMSDEGMKKGLLRPRAHAGKKRKKFWRGEDFSKSSLPQQPSSAPFSAGFLTRHPQQPSSAAVLKLLVILLWSVVGGQLLVNHWTSIWGGHGLVVGYFSTIEHQLLVVNFLWSSMNEFLERSLWLRFRERRVSALNPKQSCRRVGWKYENLPVLASFWPSTANPPWIKAFVFASVPLDLDCCSNKLESIRRAWQKTGTALNPSIYCCKTGNEKTKCKHILDRCSRRVKRVLGLFACTCRTCRSVINRYCRVWEPEHGNNNEVTKANMLETFCIQNHPDFVMVLQKNRNTLETN